MNLINYSLSCLEVRSRASFSPSPLPLPLRERDCFLFSLISRQLYQCTAIKRRLKTSAARAVFSTTGGEENQYHAVIFADVDFSITEIELAVDVEGKRFQQPFLAGADNGTVKGGDCLS